MQLPAGKICALDIGTRRTGVAISDPKQQVAFSRPEVEYETESEGLLKIKTLILKEKVSGCVVGLPVKLDGSRTEQTEKVQAWIDELEKLCPILKADERLSTEFAKNLHGFVTKDTRWDSRAAQILLETYLSSLTPRP